MTVTESKADLGPGTLNEDTKPEMELYRDSINEVLSVDEKNATYSISLSDQKAHRILNKILQLANYDAKTFVTEIKKWQEKTFHRLTARVPPTVKSTRKEVSLSSR